MAWLNSSWTYRRSITIQSSQVSSDLTDFPVYLRGSDFGASTFTNAKSAAEDFRITKSDGTTELPFEIVYYDSGANEFEVHFKADFISSSSDTIFYLYYGNSGASAYGVTDTYGRNNVWTNGFVYVNHMQSTTYGDSVGNAGASTVGGTPTTVNGKLSGNAIEFSGTNERLVHSSFSEIGGMSVFGLSFWINPDSVTDGRQILSKASSSNTDRSIWVQISDTLGYIVQLSADGTSSNRGFYSENAVTSLTTGSWQHIYSHIDLSTDAVVLNFDNVAQSTAISENGTGFPSGTRTNSQDLWIAERNDGKEDFDGDFDEIRIFDVARSSSWRDAEYTNQNSPTTFYTIGGEETDGWYDTQWQNRIEITVQASEVSSDLTDFPVYVDLSDLPATFFSKVQSNGDDIRVTKEDGYTELPFELVSINTGSSIGELHFKADFISSSSDTSFYIYYNNPSATAYAVTDTYGRNNVWSDYNAIFHKNNVTDSTGNSNTLTANGGVSAGGVNGKLGLGTEFDGSGDYYDSDSLRTTANKSTNHSFSAWFKADRVDSDSQVIFASLNGSSDRVIVSIRTVSDDIRANVYTGSWLSQNIASASFSDTTSFHHIIYSFNSSTGITAWLDGVEITGTDSDGAPTGTYSEIGNGFPSGTFDGILDEIRLRESEVTADWVSSEFTNQNTPATFYSVGSEEINGGGPAPSTFKSKNNWFM